MHSSFYNNVATFSEGVCHAGTLQYTSESVLSVCNHTCTSVRASAFHNPAIHFSSFVNVPESSWRYLSYCHWPQYYQVWYFHLLPCLYSSLLAGVCNKPVMIKFQPIAKNSSLVNLSASSVSSHEQSPWYSPFHPAIDFVTQFLPVSLIKLNCAFTHWLEFLSAIILLENNS